MSNNGVNPDSQLPVLNVRLVGRGEDAMRMEKRLICAGRALGVRVRVDWKSVQHGDPVVTIEDKLLIDHLVQTTELETLLQSYIDQHKTKKHEPQNSKKQ